MPKPPEFYTNISDYLIDRHYKPESDGTGFSKGKHTIPADLLPKHSVKSFHELAKKNGWIKEGEEEERNESEMWAEQFSLIYGCVDGAYQMDMYVF